MARTLNGGSDGTGRAPQRGGSPDAARARFAAVQQRLADLGVARRGCDAAECSALRAEEAALLRDNGGRWAEPLRSVPGFVGVAYRRGAFDHLFLDAEAFSAAPTLPPVAAPVHALTLSLRDPHRAGGVAAAVFGSSALAPIERLTLSGPWGNAGAAAVAAAPWLGAVTVLDLSACSIGPSGFAALLASSTLSRLADLDVSANPLGFEGALAALAVEQLPIALRALRLRGVGFHDGAVAALAGAPALAILRELHLTGNPISADALDELRQALVGTTIHADPDERAGPGGAATRA